MHKIIFLFSCITFTGVSHASCFEKRHDENLIDVQIEEQTSPLRVKLVVPTRYSNYLPGSNVLPSIKLNFKNPKSSVNLEMTHGYNNYSCSIEWSEKHNYTFKTQEEYNKSCLFSWAEFSIDNIEQLKDLSASLSYQYYRDGHFDCTISEFKTHELKYNKALKAQPSAAGDAASGAP